MAMVVVWRLGAGFDFDVREFVRFLYPDRQPTQLRLLAWGPWASLSPKPSSIQPSGASPIIRCRR